MMNETSTFGKGLIIGSMIGLGISMVTPDSWNNMRKTVSRTARKMKLNKMIDNITDTLTDMF